MRLLELTSKEIKGQEKIMGNFYQFYENVFSNDTTISNLSIPNYLKDISLPNVSMEQRELCEGESLPKKW